MKKQKIREVNLYITPSAFVSFFRRIRGIRNDYDFSGISELRQLLSNEKAKILHILKEEKPDSIYDLAKSLGRDFKAVRQDIRTLEKFGFVELKKISTGKREKLKPILVVDKLQININFQ